MQCGDRRLEPSGSRAVLSAVYRESYPLSPVVADYDVNKDTLRSQLRAKRRELTPAVRSAHAQAAADI